MSFPDILLIVAAASFVLMLVLMATAKGLEGLLLPGLLSYICFGSLAIYVIRAIVVSNGCGVDITWGGG